MIHDSCLPRSVIVRLIKLAHRLEDAAERHFFAPHGLTMATGRILMVLSELEQARPSELIKLLECTKSNLSQRLNTLEKAGLLTHHKPQGSDQRQVTVRLTPTGQAQARALKIEFDQRIHDIENSIPQTDWDGALNVLEVINKKFDSTLPTHTH